VKAQRRKFRTGLLSQERIQKLNDAGFQWIFPVPAPKKQKLEEDAMKTDKTPQEIWEDRFRELKELKDQQGGLKVSAQSSLGKWCKQQRAAYKKGILVEDKIQKLDELGFDFHLAQSAIEKAAKTSTDEVWNQRFEELKEYKEKKGDTNVPHKYGKLGFWVKNQRELFKTGELTEDRVNKLNELGFSWAMDWKKSNQDSWVQKYDELKEFKEKNGHCNVPFSSGMMGNWVIRQRKLYKQGRLSEDRVAKLNELGFQWSVFSQESYQEMWDQKWRELRDWKEKAGHCNVSAKSGKLGRWIAKQRDYYKKGMLSQERINKLNELGFQWSIRS